MSKMIDLTMLGMLTGRERTREEFEGLFGAAGFPIDRIVQTPTPLSVIEATAALSSGGVGNADVRSP